MGIMRIVSQIVGGLCYHVDATVIDLCICHLMRKIAQSIPIDIVYFYTLLHIESNEYIGSVESGFTTNSIDLVINT